ncbi:DNA transposase [Frankliniella fusca]|uniref:DNA transposase n=1 Tax=Frankliniella fusca TaxID=407009 RepID=A0AAE1LSG8_9NEOP|nr:DNA transposase [Frankliniella fusca]
MPSCFVPNCENGYPKDFAARQAARAAAGLPKISFFKAKEEDVEAWKRAVPRSDLPVKVLEETSENVPETAEMVEEAARTVHGIDPSCVKLPRTGWGFHILGNQQFYLKINRQGRTTHAIELDENGVVTLKVKNTLIPLAQRTATKASDIEDAVTESEKYYECEGNGFGSRAKTCKGGILRGVRCKHCRDSRKNEKKKIRRKAKKDKRTRKRSKDLSKKRAQNKQLRGKIRTLKQTLTKIWKECAKLKKGQVEKAIESLPDIQQQLVLNILQAAKRKSSKGNRYSLEWTYEAMLMRIKSPRLYEHIRKRKIMPLPSRNTLLRYMKKIHPVYGFQQVLFQVLQQKVKDWDEKDKHGCLLVDEIKIPEGVSFDKHTLKTVGLVDLDKFTPDNQKHEMADHVLEVMFQPFRGKWVQSLGCFLTKSNAKADVLSKIVLEAIGLTEESFLKVDAVVMDGASWNRSMFEKFGVGEDSSSCVHPVDENRKLWFISDFCHLVKCARNCLCPIIPTKINRRKIINDLALEEEDLDDPEHVTVNPDPDCSLAQETAPPGKGRERGSGKGRGRGIQSQREAFDSTAVQAAVSKALQAKQDAARNKTVTVPEGTVKRQHWVRLLELEEAMARKYGIGALTYVPNFSKKHVFPSGFERMNVKLAIQFFSNSVRAGMEHYRKNQADTGLEDSEPTELFIARVNALVDAMNSTTPLDALRKDNKHWEAIEGYLEYHKKCVSLAKSEGKKAFFSESTDLGSIITLRSVLELSSYLIDEIDYKYIMTARYNQDAIEQFFALVRSFSGPDSHPNPKLFAQIHRLLTVYSLVQPPPGSNVSGVLNMNTLLSAEDLIEASQKERKQKIDDILDEVLTHGEAFEPLPLSHQVDHSYLPQPAEMESNIVAFMAGFTAFRQEKIAKGCANCIMTFTQFREEAGSDHHFTKTKELYGGYTYASHTMVCLIKASERAIQDCVKNHDVHEDMYITTLRYLKLDSDQMVGCIDHMQEVTKKVVQFYLTMRLFFVADHKNKENEKAKTMKKQYAKQSKLT